MMYELKYKAVALMKIPSGPDGVTSLWYKGVNRSRTHNHRSVRSRSPEVPMNRLSALAAIPVFLIIILTLRAQQSEPPEMAFFFQSASPG